MKNLLNPSEREALIMRLQNLKPESQRKWGKLTAPQILQHLADPIRVSLGEKNAIDVSNPLFRSLIGKMVVRFIPWPRSSPTSPSFLPGKGMTEVKDFETDRQALLLLIHRFGNLQESASLPPHPVFGPLSYRDLGRLYWRHVDYHLRQFGIEA